MKSKNLIVANWKINPDSPELARTTFLAIRRVSKKLKKTQVVVCPPAIYFCSLVKLVDNKIKIGTQNVFWEGSGPYTGEIGAPIVVASGGTHVIIGHSERRELGETLEMVNRKLIAALSAGLTSILCIGEKTRDDQGNYLVFVKEQISTALSGIQKKHVENLVIAYEPVWAIGKSEAIRGENMHEMLLYIKKTIADLLGREYADSVPILYGGSVTSLNTEDILVNGHVDGLLVGRQSLDPFQFKDILLIADKIN